MLLNNAFLRARVDNPVRRAILARRVVDRLRAIAGEGDAWGYDGWMDWIARLHQEAQPRDYAMAAVDQPVIEFIAEVADIAAECQLYAPSVWRDGWGRYQRRGRSPSGTTGREWMNQASNSWSVIDSDWITARVDGLIGRSECECCGDSFFDDELRSTWSGGYVCESCRDRHYTYSERYDQWVPSAEAIEARDERGRVCIIHEADESFQHDDDEGTFVHVDYMPPPIIRDYHASKAHQLPQPDDWTRAHGNRFLGVELEVESTGARDKASIASELHRVVNGGTFGRRVFFERDGSLSDGFEIISQPMSLPALRELFQFLRNPELVRGLRSHRTTTCGLHVHVSREGLANGVIARAVTFVHAPENDAFLTALARRYNTSFCRYVEKELESAAYPGDRYEAVNLTGRATIEFRVFRGSLKYEAVVAAIEFAHALLQYCARPDLSPAGLTASAFLSWCARELADETAILREYVAQRAAGLFQHSEAA